MVLLGDTPNNNNNNDDDNDSSKRQPIMRRKPVKKTRNENCYNRNKHE